MLEKKLIRFIPGLFIQMLCLGTLTACQTGPTENLEVSPPVPPAQSTEPVEAAAASDSQADTQANSQADSQSQATNDPLPNQTATAYQEAVNLASSAFTLGQQATSPDDWDLIAGRWEQALQKLKQVPADDQHYATAQTKLQDYERNLAQAKQRLANLRKPPTEIALTKAPVAISNRAAPTSAPTSAAPTAPTSTGNRIPIIERHGGTPVVEVSFNDKSYPMILDTGASHTHITRAMANELGIQTVGQASVATASNAQAVVDVGYVNSIQVGNISHRNLPVSIGDSVPIGLLGNDVYKNFDVILQVNSVEFRPR